MQRWLLALILTVSFAAHADPVKLIPVHTPTPVYPYELGRNGTPGQTRVKFIVNSDGSVSDVKVIKSSHSLFSKASKKAVRQWRFKPWAVTADQPAKIEVVAPMMFSRDGRPQLPMDANAILEKLSCSSINNQVAQRDNHEPQKQLHELTVFSYLSRYLKEGVATSQLPETERNALVEEFVAEIPEIVERCHLNPEAYYADQLPDSVRAVL